MPTPPPGHRDEQVAELSVLVLYVLSLRNSATDKTLAEVLAAANVYERKRLSTVLGTLKAHKLIKFTRDYELASPGKRLDYVVNAYVRYHTNATVVALQLGLLFDLLRPLPNYPSLPSMKAATGGQPRDYLELVQWLALLSKSADLYLTNERIAFADYGGYRKYATESVRSQMRSLLEVENPEFFLVLETGFQRLVINRYNVYSTLVKAQSTRYINAVAWSPQAPKLDGDIAEGIEDLAFEFAPLLSLAPASASVALPRLRLMYALLRGDAEEARKFSSRDYSARDRVGALDCLHELHLFATEQITAAELDVRSKRFKTSRNYQLVNAFLAFVTFANGKTRAGADLLSKVFVGDQVIGMTYVFAAWTALWADYELPAARVDLLHSVMTACENKGRHYVAGELAATLAKLLPSERRAGEWRQRAKDNSETFGYHYLNTLIVRPDPAEKVMSLLTRISERPLEAPPAATSQRIQWSLDFVIQTYTMKLQSPAKKGGWTPGKTLTLPKLLEEFAAHELPPEDEKVAAAITDYYGKAPDPGRYRYAEQHLFLAFPKLVYHLAGHPRVVLAKAPDIQVTIKLGETALSMHETEEGIRLEFRPAHWQSHFAFERLTQAHFVAYQLTDDEIALSKSIGAGVTVGAERKAQLERALPTLRDRVNVRSVIDLDDSGLEQVTGGTQVAIHLLPNATAYDVELLVRPLPEAPYMVVAGEGLPRDIVVVNPEADEPLRVVLNRHMEGERRATRHVIAACPALGEPIDLPHHFVITDPEQALELIVQLRDLSATDDVVVEYPKGQRFKVAAFAKTDQLNLNVGKQKDWFGVSGQLAVDEDRVLDFLQLLQHTRESKSRFVEVTEGEFVELSKELQARLQKMEALLHQRGKGAALPTLGANVFDELLADLGDLNVDQEWTLQLDRVEEARQLKPTIPTDFDAQLRDYQEEGYRWLMRLAAWGVGACLADDMGLGKTVQALAVLTSRAENGPALVLAPASVTRNWLRETARFAPSLTPKLLASSKEVEMLADLGPGDLLLVSYGLLPYIDVVLQEIHFATIILDEAQAIKNAASQRAQAVVALQGDFKVATTGTPIENNLLELWSLFRFLNPGLLGSQEAFASKYARPLSIGGNTEVLRDQLRNLVQPFILRRRKDDVLKELPAKTEIILEVEQSTKERALYEAIRREALEQLASATPDQQRFMVLKQLTRLRQAACHPKLVRANSKLESSKLALVGETIQELLDNGHKALIFSQFVQHLKLVEDWVKGQGIEYLYLDGSTPGKKREELVQRFQSGQAKLFLISLKAGGTGLNLTEADYVLHLDPWWNPAVEDQASDRAHRMGQLRPVTVYRFVSLGTIEEKIIELHADKRDLADQILAGTDTSARLSIDEMLLMLEGAGQD